MSALPVDAIADAAPSFGALLRAYRERAGLNRVALSRRAGRGRDCVARLERGDTAPHVATAVALADALGLADGERATLVAMAWDGVPVRLRRVVPADATFGALLRRHRRRSGMSTTALGRCAKCHAAAISRLELGERIVSHGLALALARGLQLDDEDTDRLMVAGGYCPPSVAALGWDATLAAVCRVLLDDALPDGDLATFRAVVESIAAKWTRVPRHPALVEG